MRPSPSALLFLIATFAGLGTALWFALGVSDGLSLQSVRGGGDVAVWVNDRAIGVGQVQRALAALQNDRDQTLSDFDKLRVLDTLVREELLIQKAVELGLVRSDHSVRNNLVAAMLQQIVESAALAEPDEKTLRDFYAQHPDLGLGKEQWRVGHFSLPMASERDRERIRTTATELQQGASFATLMAELSDANRYLPSVFLNHRQLLSYLGPSLTVAVTELSPGDIAGPIEAREAAHFLWLMERKEARRPDFSQVRREVAVEWRRRQEESIIDAYISRLRSRADIRVPQPESR